MKKISIILLSVFLIAGLGFSEDATSLFGEYESVSKKSSNEIVDETSNNPSSAFDFKNSLGAYVIVSDEAFGGLEYQRWLNDRIGLTAQLSLYYNNYSWSGDNYDQFSYDFNLQTDISLYRFEAKNFASRLFAWVLTGNYGSYKSAENKLASNVLLGGGFGCELIFWRHLSVPLQMGYLGSFPNDKFVDFCFSSGIRYKF